MTIDCTLKKNRNKKACKKKVILVRKTSKHFPHIVGKNEAYNVRSWKRNVPLQELLDKGYKWGQGNEFIGGYEYEYMVK